MNKLLLLLGVIGIVAGGIFMVKFVNQPGGSADKSNLILAAVFFVVALICFAVFFFKKFRSEADQDISITKF